MGATEINDVKKQWQATHDQEIQARMKQEVDERDAMKKSGAEQYEQIKAQLVRTRTELHEQARKQQEKLSEEIQRNDVSESDNDRATTWVKVADIVDKVNSFMNDASIPGTNDQEYMNKLLQAKKAVKQTAVKQTAVKQTAVKQKAVKQKAVKQKAVKQKAVKQKAVKQKAVVVDVCCFG
ncbi:hypothetical protein GNI_014870 [Gregarina niphandrodes]|uniref:Uncharacterized protein n=1 Tax=Gregarina niphandrodes TaxID=110365 RepID=A0A023BCP1_GRENI|nr:hypothetical protein GNI_014870 [Gregarina niphandrodes]EZG83325.1 hypothetical protein GNI_014870 [Gregarina niphandrodes]|eukprot:XP_011128949.1 hypothetical protein GNI_014870 [Gregarina niphandrodes]